MKILFLKAAPWALQKSFINSVYIPIRRNNNFSYSALKKKLLEKHIFQKWFIFFNEMIGLWPCRDKMIPWLLRFLKEYRRLRREEWRTLYRVAWDKGLKYYNLVEPVLTNENAVVVLKRRILIVEVIKTIWNCWQ